MPQFSPYKSFLAYEEPNEVPIEEESPLERTFYSAMPDAPAPVPGVNAQPSESETDVNVAPVAVTKVVEGKQYAVIDDADSAMESTFARSSMESESEHTAAARAALEDLEKLRVSKAAAVLGVRPTLLKAAGTPNQIAPTSENLSVYHEGWMSCIVAGKKNWKKFYFCLREDGMMMYYLWDGKPKHKRQHKGQFTAAGQRCSSVWFMDCGRVKQPYTFVVKEERLRIHDIKKYAGSWQMLAEFSAYGGISSGVVRGSKRLALIAYTRMCVLRVQPWLCDLQRQHLTAECMPCLQCRPAWRVHHRNACVLFVRGERRRSSTMASGAVPCSRALDQSTIRSES